MKLLKINNVAFAKTLEAWQPFYSDRKLTKEDAIEIKNNLNEFFLLLNKWQRCERK